MKKGGFYKTLFGRNMGRTTTIESPEAEQRRPPTIEIERGRAHLHKKKT